VFAAAAVLRKARRGDPGLLDRVIRYTRADLVNHTPITEKHVDSGMTVAQLCRAAVTYSDNTAGNLLLRQLGGPRGLTRFFRSLGDRDSRLDRWETDLSVWRPGERRDTTKPAAIAANLRKLTVGRALHPRDRVQLNRWLRANTTGGKRIRAGLPKSWTVGDKTGTGFFHGAANDIAVATPPRGAPIVIAIYTTRRARDAAKHEATIAKAATILARGLGRLDSTR
jgi:beta-lactamase class A